jgi:uncharacterized protein YbaA (DUF1428 family)
MTARAPEWLLLRVSCHVGFNQPFGVSAQDDRNRPQRAALVGSPCYGCRIIPGSLNQVHRRIRDSRARGKDGGYRKWAENGAAIFREYGCIEIVDSWEDNVPGGKHTDFRHAVDAKDGEKIVFSWQVWPDKATLDSAEAKMHEDERLEVSGEIPFDPKRLILGCFEPLCTMGRE